MTVAEIKLEHPIWKLKPAPEAKVAWDKVCADSALPVNEPPLPTQ